MFSQNTTKCFFRGSIGINFFVSSDTYKDKATHIGSLQTLRKRITLGGGVVVDKGITLKSINQSESKVAKCL